MIQQSDHARQGGRLPGIVFWILWVALTTLAATVGLLLSDQQVVGLPTSDFNGDNGIYPLSLWLLGFMWIVGPLVGIVQGLLLKAINKKFNAIAWALSTGLGVFLALIICVPLTIWGLQYEFACLTSPLAAFLFGAIMGGIQGVNFAQAGNLKLWAGTSSLAWVASIIALWLVSVWFTVNSQEIAPFPSPYAPDGYLRFAVCWAVGIATYAAITGFVLLRILADYNHPSSSVAPVQQ